MRDYFDLLRRHSAAATLRRIAERVPVHTFANNHYAGHAPDTCRQLRGAVEERR